MTQHKCLACGNQFGGPDSQVGQVACPRCRSTATTPAAAAGAGGYPQGPAAYPSGAYPQAAPAQGVYPQAAYPSAGYPPMAPPPMAPAPSPFAPPPARRGSPVGKLIGAGVVVVAVVAIGVAIWWFGGGRYKAFKPHLAEYTKTPVLPPERAPALARLSGLPVNVTKPIPGKVVCVDVSENEVHSLQSSLPDDLRAKTPEEVGTIAQIRKSTANAGSYTTGQKAFAETWEVSLVDLKTNQLLGKRSFTGTPPQTVRSKEGDQTGKPKPGDVVPWLESAKRGGG